MVIVPNSSFTNLIDPLNDPPGSFSLISIFPVICLSWDVGFAGISVIIGDKSVLSFNDEEGKKSTGGQSNLTFSTIASLFTVPDVFPTKVSGGASVQLGKFCLYIPFLPIK